uniref:Uncharacterized protein n=1 Tax=Anguilla anguilla TaxID=7936 RepID=A0A0E9UHY0_ANGAN
MMQFDFSLKTFSHTT